MPHYASLTTILALILAALPVASWHAPLSDGWRGGETGSPTATPAFYGEGRRSYPSPDGRWLAVLDDTTGSLELRSGTGEAWSVFSEGSTIQAATWSPDSRRLLAVRANWVPKQPKGSGVQGLAPIQIWQVLVPPARVSQPAAACPGAEAQAPASGLATCLFQSSEAPGDGGEQICFGHWSPNSRYLVFWHGPLGASLATDGLTPYVLDVAGPLTTRVSAIALLNRRYHSWAPDSSALVMTVGGYRSAMVDKELIRFDTYTRQVTKLIKSDQQVPGIVAWSPRGDWIAYAAVPADETGPEWADWMSWDNPAVAGRRIYLLDAASGRWHRLNDAQTFQDAPLWSEDGRVLYYVERQGDSLVLMAADPVSGAAQAVPGARQPLPEVAGYYGQTDLDELLEYRPGGRLAPGASPGSQEAEIGK